MKLAEIIKNQNLVIACPQEWMAKELCQELKRLGRTWNDGDSYDDTNWSTYKEETMYCPSIGTYGTGYTYNTNQMPNLQVIPFLEVEEFQFKVGDKVLVLPKPKNCQIYVSTDMKSYIGKVCTISSVGKSSVELEEDPDEDKWCFPFEMLQKVEEKEYFIQVKNNHVNISTENKFDEFYTVKVKGIVIKDKTDYTHIRDLYDRTTDSVKERIIFSFHEQFVLITKRIGLVSDLNTQSFLKSDITPTKSEETTNYQHLIGKYFYRPSYPTAIQKIVKVVEVGDKVFLINKEEGSYELSSVILSTKIYQ